MLGKVIVLIFFIVFFLLTLLLGTLRFEILNSDFVLPSFERNGIYEKLPQQFAKALPNDPNIPKQERGDYAKIALAISPGLAKKVVETNLASVFDFVNGKNSDVTISLNPSDFGMPGSAIRWSLSNNAPGDTFSRFQIIQGLGNKLLAVFLVGFIVLGALYKLAGSVAILTAGIVALLLGGIARLFLLIIVTNTPAKEPAQVLLLLLSSSIFSDMALSWIVVGIGLILIWVVVKNLPAKISQTKTSRLLLTSIL